jgi:hypothetical protein
LGGIAAGFWALFLLASGAGLGCGSATGMSSPPVNIPAPVAGLISVTSPDGGGQVRLTGADGSVEAGATVNVTVEAGPSGLKLQEAPPLATTTATSTGSFALDFPASLGQFARVIQGQTVVIEEGVEYEFQEGPPIFVEVIPGRTRIAATPFGSSFAPSFGDGCVAGVFGGTTTHVECFSPSTLLLTASFDIAGFQADDLALDDSNGDFYFVQRSTNQVLVRDPVGDPRGSLTMTQPIAVAADATNAFAVVVQGGSSPSLTMVDDAGPVPSEDASADILHPTDGSATTVETFAVSTSQDGFSQPWFAALTNFSNGDTVLTVFPVTSLPPGASFGTADQVNLGSGAFDSVVLFNGATEVLVTDSGNDRAIRFEGAGFGTQTVYPVGGDPRGVAVSEDFQLAFVCNHDDHTISIIDLVDDVVLGEMPTGLGVGLGPTDIAINPSPFTGLVTNDVDQTVSVFFVDDVLTALGF